ncbi:hypothetical protein APZ00_11780 [Pannonibacter phragmitetus]|uniref:Uncharacterized protein n=1 Tax=Pannonibacter phragmitetus TaxID=121719 RepID=A0A0U3Q506_9HYPH|nr:hypothetical protein APZ00_11780 [Pannonibacter phragmitetus]
MPSSVQMTNSMTLALWPVWDPPAFAPMPKPVSTATATSRQASRTEITGRGTRVFIARVRSTGLESSLILVNQI